MVKLAEDRFTLAVAGQFKRGKSSLMNAVIGRNLLPTGILPLTSAITILRFGPRERLVISREKLSLDEEAPVAALPEYVTEEGNPGNRLRIKAVYVEFPSSFLRRGLEFVDTPGIGSAIAANTATTYDFIPQCDAVLFVTSADGPLAEAELAFLDRIRLYVRKIFFVVNKMDLLAPGEREGVLRFIADGLRQQLGIQGARLFPISSRRGLDAKATQDPAMLAASGLPALERALAEFLTSQRGATFLASILARTEGLLDTASDQAALERRNTIQQLRKGILGSIPADLPAPAVNAPCAAASVADEEPLESALSLFLSSQQNVAASTAIQNRAEEAPGAEPKDAAQAVGLPVAVGEAADDTDLPLPVQPHAAVSHEEARLPEEEPKPVSEAAILQSFSARACPACEHLSHAQFSNFATWQYVLATNEAVQRTFAQKHGLCPLHTWQLAAIASPHGLSLGFATMMERLSGELATLIPEAPRSAEAVLALGGRPATCVACRLLAKIEHAYVLRLAEVLGSAPARDAYARSKGVCLRHLGLLLAATADGEGRRFLLTEAVRHLDELSEDMQSFAMKHEATRRYLQNQDEADAWMRTLIQIAGHRSLCVPWSEEA
jgi:hypothetical protein